MTRIIALRRPLRLPGVISGSTAPRRHLCSTPERRTPWRDHHQSFRVEDVDIMTLARKKQHSLSLADLVR